MSLGIMIVVLKVNTSIFKHFGIYAFKCQGGMRLSLYLDSVHVLDVQSFHDI